MTCRICVLGTVVMDVVVQAPRFPAPGEIVLGSDFATFHGGKGANRAVAAARLGAEVSLVGCVGDDAWGSELRATLAAEGVETAHVTTHKGEATGVGVITVATGGNITIIEVPGANLCLSPEEVEAAGESIAAADMLVLHLGLAEAVLAKAVALARRAETRVLLHAVPDGAIPPGLLSQVDVLVARESGARAIVGVEDEVSASGLARRIDALGPGRVVITRGDKGALLFDGERMLEEEAFRLKPVDTTGSSAAFVGALAVALAEGVRDATALRFALAAEALAATRRGALGSMPTREEVDQLVGQHAPGPAK